MSQFLIAKMNDDQNLVFGWANVAVSKDTAAADGGEQFYDLQEDSIPPAELERAAYEFVLEFREADAMHEGPAIGKLVESIVFTEEKLEKFAMDPVTGTIDVAKLNTLKELFPPRWWVGFKLNDQSYQAVKSGKFKMFSIAGEADRLAA